MKVLLLKKIYRKLTGKYYTIEELKKYGIKIGKNCHFYTNKIDLNHGFLISIGDNVTISDARILAHDGSTKKFLGYSRVGKVCIGDNVFIGADAIILPGIKIGNNVIVGAGTIVTKDIPDNSIVVGNPGYIIDTFDNYISKNRKIMHKKNTWDTHYSKKSNEEKKK